MTPLPLLTQVEGLLAQAIESHPDAPATQRLRAARAGLHEPLRVAIAGRVKAGKSTLLNALIGEELAPTDAGECTRIPTWYCDGTTYRVTMCPRGSGPQPLRFHRESGALHVDLGARAASDVERLVVEWPSASLREVTLIDTPGLGSISADVSERAERFLTDDGHDPDAADAVLYLMRHLHTTDLGFLEAFREHVSAASPLNAIAVLSRADEVGGGRPDGMVSAARVAARYRDDPRLRRLCQTVLPVAALLAQAAVTLGEAEYQDLRRVASASDATIDRLLLSADNFAHDCPELELTTAARAALLARLGLFGLRVSIPLIRDGAARNATELGRVWTAMSGIRQLRSTLSSLFAARRDVLKARAALDALDFALGTPELTGDTSLASGLERVLAGAHEFAELRLLDAVRRGTVALRAEDASEVERLLDLGAASPAERLSLPAGSEHADIRDALLSAISKWQRRANNPMSTADVADAARTIVRTCEGMVAALAAEEVDPVSASPELRRQA